jgi:hypothetical protein
MDQRTLLTDMLTALIKTEASVDNILQVVGVHRGGEQFLSGAAQGSGLSLASVAEQTLKRYAGGDDSTKGSEGSGFVERKCWGCGLPHPWSRKEKGKYVVICPNAPDKPGIRANAAIQIKDFQERRGRKTAKSSKRKNVNTLSWDDIPKERRAVLLQQHHSGLVVTTDGGSVASSITGITTPQRPGARNSVTLHQDVIVLTGTSSLPPIPVAIHSPMAHITLETGTANEEKDCPNLRCVFDNGQL